MWRQRHTPSTGAAPSSGQQESGQWAVRKSVPGVVEVNAFGGELKTYEVRLDPQRLLSRRITVNRVFEAIRRNNSSAGGGYLERNGQQRVIRTVGLINDLDELGDINLETTPDGTPIHLRDVAEVRFASMICAASCRA
jgi:cobalt-zinc-cadmium resistance protein CzcA